MKSGGIRLAFFFVVCVVTSTDAKGIKVGGVKIKPKTPSIPIPIPIVVPVPIVIGSSSRNTNRNDRKGLECYSCEGKDNELCALNPTSSSIKREYCPSNHYCVVTRKESTTSNLTSNNGTNSKATNLPGNTTTIITDVVQATNKNETVGLGTGLPENVTSSNVQVSNNNDTVITVVELPTTTSTATSTTTSSTMSSVTIGEAITTETINATETVIEPLGRQRRSEGASSVHIWRGCKSSDFLQGSLLSSSGNSSFTQVCKTNLCNSGDGRLKCYECKGTGVSSPCMTNPASMSNIVTCKPNEYCQIWRRVTTGPSNQTVVSVTRGCKEVNSLDYLHKVKVASRINNGIFGCSTDFCNEGNANKIFDVKRNTAPSGSCYSVLSIFVAIFHVYLLR